jgi:hypothetical protein
MGQPVKLSDELVDDARAVVPFSQRSIAGQIKGCHTSSSLATMI